MLYSVAAAGYDSVFVFNEDMVYSERITSEIVSLGKIYGIDSGYLYTKADDNSFAYRMDRSSKTFESIAVGSLPLASANHCNGTYYFIPRGATNIPYSSNQPSRYLDKYDMDGNLIGTYDTGSVGNTMCAPTCDNTYVYVLANKLYYPTHGRIYKIQISDMTLAGYYHIGPPPESYYGPSLSTDGTYLYRLVYSASNVFYKYNCSDMTLVDSAYYSAMPQPNVDCFNIITSTIEPVSVTFFQYEAPTQIPRLGYEIYAGYSTSPFSSPNDSLVDRLYPYTLIFRQVGATQTSGSITIVTDFVPQKPDEDHKYLWVKILAYDAIRRTIVTVNDVTDAAVIEI